MTDKQQDERQKQVLLAALAEEYRIGLLTSAEYTKRAKEILEDAETDQ